ncbi:MAG: SOS response-associated peptidase [Flavobacteriaceae bacterium]|nr:SOS response-associated peptidase [Flavobacteriaceae bacterium]
MCYQTRQERQAKDLELRYRVKLVNEEYRNLFNQPSYHLNGFSHPNMLVIPQDQQDVLAPGVWGIVPDDRKPDEVKAYYKEAVRYGAGLNAQSEKLFNHFIYRNVALTQRCIIPVTGFFEPHTHQKKKFPFYIHRKDNETISLAGIYTVIGTYITFTILTKKASPLIEKVHNLKKRQPVILNESHEMDWLNSSNSQSDVLDLISSPYGDEELETYPISKDLYSRSIDSNREDIVKRVDYPELGLFV